MLPQLQALRANFIQTGTYQAPVLRTYKTNYNEAIVQDYITATDGGRQIVPNAINNISAAILSPTAQIDGYINIDNGWSERRMSFIMHVAVPDRFSNSPRTVVLTGYSDHPETNFAGTSLDPNMRLYFNTSTILSNMSFRAPNGAIINKQVMMDSSHLLNRSIMTNIIKAQQQTYADNQLYYATPRNVIFEMTNRTGARTGAFPGLQADYRTQSNSMAVDRSRLDNAVPTSYLAKILNTVTTEMSGLDAGTTADEVDALSNASAGVREQDISVDGVMVALSMFDDGFYLQHGYITWGQMCRLIPNLDNVTVVARRQAVMQQSTLPTAEAGNFSGWQGANAETLIATRVSQLLPAIMTSCMVATVSLWFSNDNHTATPEVKITGGQTFIPGLEFIDVSRNFISRFINEVAPTITDQGRSIVSMVIQSGLSTETYISISRNGEPEVPFCAPTFCDALYTPVLGTNKEQLTHLATDLQNIANSVNTVNFQSNWIQ